LQVPFILAKKDQDVMTTSRRQHHLWFVLYEIGKFLPTEFGYWLRQQSARRYINYMGENVTINRGVGIVKDIEIGSNTYIANGTCIDDRVSISHNCNIGVDVLFNTDSRSHLGLKRRKGKITVSDNVWIGSRAIILQDVKIGSHSVVGAGAVINKDVPPYSLAVGNPMVIHEGKYSE
jgi:acetyltransferase-like isoleucine patch superfamily enzyme